MKTKTLLGALAIIGLLSARAGAQVTVSTAVTNGLAEPYNVVEDTNANIYISDSGNDRIVWINAATQAASTLAGVAGAAGSNDGGPPVGYNPANFNNPQGLLVVSIGGTNGLLVTDSGNNLIRFVNLTNGNVVTLAGNTNTPTGAINAAGTNASFNQPIGMDQDTNGNVYIADEFDNTIRVMNLNDPVFGVTNLVLTDGTTFHRPTAVAFVGTNQLWVADSGNNTIKLITLATPTTGTLTTYMGGNNSRNYGTTNSPIGSLARFNLPSGLLWINGLGLLISDTDNNSIRLATSNPAYGATNYAVSTFAGTTGGQGGSAVNGSALSATFSSPEGLCQDPAYGAFLVADLKNNLLRRITTGLPPPPPPAPTILTVTTNYGLISLTWSTVATATSYNVERSPSSGAEITIASTTGTSYTDTNVVDGTTYYYVVSASNASGQGPNSAEVSATPPLPPVPNPQIGYVTFPPPNFTSVFNVGSQAGLTFNNDVPVVIIGASGSQTFYNYSNTLASAAIPDPTSASASAPVGYVDGLSENSVSVLTVAQILPALSIKAIGEQSGHPNSAVVSALFQFVVGNPQVVGGNAAQFGISNITASAQMYYTTDGSDPTNDGSGTSIGPISNGQMLSLNFGSGTNLLFKIRGFKVNYQPSAIVSNLFSTAAFLPNIISFGFDSGEASSDFVASPGQTFYAPVTLSTLPGTTIYSLQFNLIVTNAGPNPGPVLAITPADFTFTSMLEQPNPTNTALFEPIPPEGVDQTLTLQSLLFWNTSENLMGVGWLERYSETNLYNTLAQDLIQYSQAHDDVFLQANGKVILGGCAFPVPANTTPGQTYQIQISRPSATSDGIGAPGSDVFIDAPTNGSTGGGSPINAIKYVTVGSRGYIAGDCYPFRWFNAGDFGDSNLDNADVEQVFEAACYQLNQPPTASDFLDSMNSCGQLGYLTNGYYAPFTTLFPGPLPPPPPFDGNDTTIDLMVFGDGSGTPNETAGLNLDVNDVYVTLRRSLDPGRTWYYRFWTNDLSSGYQGLAAIAVPNVFNQSAVKKLSGGKTIQPAINPPTAPTSITNTPSVNFASTDFVATAGQVLNIPVSASVFGNYPLRVAMLNISVVPLDGSPPLTAPASFAPNGTNTALGTPYITDAKGNGNYAAAWLDSTIMGISNNAVIGTLTVTIPENATSLSSYAIHFDHASGSPNGIALFAKHTLTGLITLSSRTNSYYNDGIPDSWRLRYFGTIYNLLSVSNADADGTGMNNWQKYVAGLDPTDPTSQLLAGLDQPMAQNQQDSVIDWPSVSGKTYIIQRSASLFPAAWSAVATNTGTGGYMEIHDSPTNQFRYYRVSVQ